MTSLTYLWPNHPASGDEQNGLARVIQQLSRQMANLASAAQSDQVQLSAWSSGDSSVSFAPRDQMSLVERIFTLQGREAVLTYLERRPHLIPLLMEARSMIPLYFQQARIALRLLEASEDYGSQQLGLYILVPSADPGDALARLAAFDQEWWLDAMERARDDLFITVAAA